MEFTKEQKILQQVISEAWNNPSFKQELISSPQETIEKLTGKKFDLPEGKTLQVFDQSNENVVCLNIPQQPNFENKELTDNELELVAGGQILAVMPGGGGCFYPWPWEPSPWDPTPTFPVES